MVKMTMLFLSKVDGRTRLVDSNGMVYRRDGESITEEVVEIGPFPEGDEGAFRALVPPPSFHIERKTPAGKWAREPNLEEFTHEDAAQAVIDELVLRGAAPLSLRVVED